MRCGAVATAAAPSRILGCAMSRKVRRRIFTLGLTLLLPTGVGRAQMAESSRLLAMPAGAVLCRSAPVTAADSAAFILAFRDTVTASAKSRARESTVAYDSLGRPLYMLVTVRDLAGSPPELTLFAVRLAPFRAGGRVEPDSDLPSAASFGAPRESALTEADLEQAHRLATDLWMRGCMVPHTAPPGETQLAGSASVMNTLFGSAR